MSEPSDIRQYEKFLRDEYSWFRLSEMSYDQYMTSIKL